MHIVHETEWPNFPSVLLVDHLKSGLFVIGQSSYESINHIWIEQQLWKETAPVKVEQPQTTTTLTHRRVNRSLSEKNMPLQQEQCKVSIKVALEFVPSI